MDDIHYAINTSYQKEIQCVYSDYNSEQLIFRLRIKVNNKIINTNNSLDQSDQIYKLTNFQNYLFEVVNLLFEPGLIRHPSNILYIYREMVYYNNVKTFGIW